MGKHELWELQSMQAAPLSVKVRLTQDRIRQWVEHYGEDGVYISFSGGKDSTVLLHLVRELYPNVPAVFVNVPTQYPELREFAQSFDNVEIINPKMSFMQVCEQYGFPFISKEVSECVYGARKYLTSLEAETSLADRQTDRLPYAQFYRKLLGIGEYQRRVRTPKKAIATGSTADHQSSAGAEAHGDQPAGRDGNDGDYP